MSRTRDRLRDDVISAARAWMAEDRRFTMLEAGADPDAPREHHTKQFQKRERALDALAHALRVLNHWENP